MTDHDIMMDCQPPNKFIKIGITLLWYTSFLAIITTATTKSGTDAK